ncbi:hypothetical protein QFZ82_006966 [Streptomyces sp. V4I23]|nr:hypothetical protein [Streptomyces sp. V4I23]
MPDTEDRPPATTSLRRAFLRSLRLNLWLSPQFRQKRLFRYIGHIAGRAF